jgi:hypothetical protein
MYYCFQEGMIWRGFMHDLNKFRPSNFFAYARYFYLKNGKGKFVRDKTGYYDASNTGDDAFDRAWHYHQRTNKHHWQFWTMARDDGTFRCLDMPKVYVREMLCDWRGAGRAQGTNPDGGWKEVYNYYMKNYNKMHFTDDTRAYLGSIIMSKYHDQESDD